MFNDTQSTGEVAPTIAEHFAERLALPASPNVLKLAETTYRDRRKARAAIDLALNAEAAKMRAAEATRETDDFKRLARERTTLDAEVSAARVEMVKRREAFGATVADDLAPAVASYRIELERALDELEALVEAGAGCARDFATRGLPMPRLIEAAPALAERLRAMRQMVRA